MTAASGTDTICAVFVPVFAEAVAATPAVATVTPASATPSSTGSERSAIARERPAPVTHGELHVALGVSGGATDWSGDPLGYGGVVLGFRLFRVVTPFVGGALGYARVDQRLLTRLTFGVDLGLPFWARFRPHVYAAFVHQHEESLASVAQEPAGALLGIGNGIRHRAGMHAGLGLDVVLRRSAAYDITLGPDVSFMYLGYSSGPTWYFIAGVTAAGHFRLF